MKINWWEIGDNQYIRVKDSTLSKIYREIREQHDNLSRFTKELGFKAERLHNCIKYKKQTITVQMFKIILKKLDIPFQNLNDQIISIGTRKKLTNLNFPLEIVPEYGEILSHAFFDGYADWSIFRYSNYDVQIRNQFLELTKRLKLGKINANAPDNYKQDIDLPCFIPRLLSAVFKIDNFYSDKCRIPERFLKIVKENKRFGWYFIKGAYLDEGTVTGGQIFIVRGIKNYPLAKDILKLCDLVNLKARIKLTNKDAYSIFILEESYDKLKEIFASTIFTDCKKMDRVFKKIDKLKSIKEGENKYKSDLKIILEKAKKEKYITIKDAENLCGVATEMARCRLYLLVYLGNMELIKNKRNCIFIFKKEELPKTIPKINDIRRARGWR